jgi:DNA repair protein RecN (Recombination protein N)
MLNDNSFQLNVVDSFAGTASLKADYRQSWSSYTRLKREYTEAKENADKSKADLEYYQFQLKQLVEANLKAGEEDDLVREQEMLSHAEEIKLGLFNSADLFSREGMSVLVMLREIRANLLKISNFLPEGKTLLERTESSLIELDDLAAEIDRKLNSVEADPERLVIVNNRLDLIYSLILKHRVNNLDELIAKREEIRGIVNSIVTSDERLAELSSLLSAEHDKLGRKAVEISEKRASVLPEIEQKVTELLRQLGMPDARFRVSLSRTNDFTSSGIDQGDFLFSANRQVAPENLARIASGGELSRVMLSLKSLLTRYNNLPTIIFDEIDSGVSGEVADKVGQILSGMGKYMQVVNITHLPQVASRGTKHYHVYKDNVNDSTLTRVKLLTRDERIIEVARLLSGSEVTEAAMRNARELLKSSAN